MMGRRPPSIVPVQNMSGRTERLIGLVLAGVVSAPLLFWGVSAPMDFDGYWHVFVARQDDWSNFWDEVMANTHPPLFHLLLRLAMCFGYAPLTYRAVSILAAVGATYLVGRIVRRMEGPLSLALLASLAFGLSSSAIPIGLEVRSYMLCTFLVLLAFHAYLNLIDHGFGAADATDRATFGVGAGLAMASHYSAVFFLAAAVGAPVAYAAFRPEFRCRLDRGLRARWLANLATFGPPAAIASAFLFSHAGNWYGHLGHLPAFLFHPQEETARAFVMRQLHELLRLFYPLPVETPGGLALAVATIGATLLVVAKGGGSDAVRSRMPAVFAILIVVFLGVGGLAGRYPFGGLLRHQFVVFPFLLLSVFAAAVVMTNAVGRSPYRGVVVALVVLGVVANAFNATRTFRPSADRIGEREMSAFRRAISTSPAVYLDQFSLIAFFTRYHDWDWRFVRGPWRRRHIDVWNVSRSGAQFFVCRDRDTWVVDLTETRVYRRLATCLRRTRVDSVALFGLEHPGVMTPVGNGAPADTIREKAAHEGLLARDIMIDGGSVYARFGLAQGNPHPDERGGWLPQPSNGPLHGEMAREAHLVGARLRRGVVRVCRAPTSP